jgi:hypothetical protein
MSSHTRSASSLAPKFPLSLLLVENNALAVVEGTGIVAGKLRFLSRTLARRAAQRCSIRLTALCASAMRSSRGGAAW